MQSPSDHPAVAGKPWPGRHLADSPCFADSLLLQESIAEREEIQRLKWIESEKAGRDIGAYAAVTRWVMWHRAHWQMAYRRMRQAG